MAHEESAPRRLCSLEGLRWLRERTTLAGFATLPNDVCGLIAKYQNGPRWAAVVNPVGVTTVTDRRLMTGPLDAGSITEGRRETWTGELDELYRGSSELLWVSGHSYLNQDFKLWDRRGQIVMDWEAYRLPAHHKWGMLGEHGEYMLGEIEKRPVLLGRTFQLADVIQADAIDGLLVAKVRTRKMCLPEDYSRRPPDIYEIYDPEGRLLLRYPAKRSAQAAFVTGPRGVITFKQAVGIYRDLRVGREVRLAWRDRFHYDCCLMRIGEYIVRGDFYNRYQRGLSGLERLDLRAGWVPLCNVRCPGNLNVWSTHIYSE